MGSIIHLAVGRLEIDWGKNLGFIDHSALYQISDLAKVSESSSLNKNAVADGHRAI